MTDLDDFFAKKDRKKSKGVKKFTTTEELAKKLEETHKKEKEKLKEKKTLSSQNVDGDGELRGERQEEDEWKEFEEEKKDYTNLKIQNLQISETPSGEDGEDGDGEDGEHEMEENEAGEMVPRKRQPTGPWKVMASSQDQEPEREREREREERRAEPAPMAADAPGGGGGPPTRSSYVPPHQRNISQHTPNQPGPGSRLRNKVAPDINNEAFFPTLSAAKTIEPNSAWGRRRHEEGRGFEEVRNSKSHSRFDPKMAPSGQGPKLELGNKWDALTQDQS